MEMLNKFLANILSSMFFIGMLGSVVVAVLFAKEMVQAMFQSKESAEAEERGTHADPDFQAPKP